LRGGGRQGGKEGTGGGVGEWVSRLDKDKWREIRRIEKEVGG